MNNAPQTEGKPQPVATGMSSRKKMAWLVVGVIAFAAVMALTGKNRQPCGCRPLGDGATLQVARPRLLDLGATKCIPCKRMAPILEELKEEYAGRMEVDFIDVWENRDAAGRYRIESIPTQIFFDASGKELYRHQGFIAKDDILKKWRELGIDITN
jgi:thioredoxin 1